MSDEMKDLMFAMAQSTDLLELMEMQHAELLDMLVLAVDPENIREKHVVQEDVAEMLTAVVEDEDRPKMQVFSDKIVHQMVEKGVLEVLDDPQPDPEPVQESKPDTQSNKKGKKNQKKSKSKVVRKPQPGNVELPVWMSSEARNQKHKSRDVNITVNMSQLGGGIELLSNTNLILTDGRRYGLVGKNGAGKSTLLTHVSKYLFPDFPRHLHVLHVQQECPGNDTRVIDYVLKCDIRREILVQEKARLEALGEKISAEEQIKLQETFTELSDIDAWSAEARASSILAGLQFTPEMMQVATKDLSGGWRMRVSLAGALFVTPDVLLLDEPTNHLDFPSVKWLEDYLREYKKTLIVVSHDRTFLNYVITDVIYLHKKQLMYYKGDFEMFEKIRSGQIKTNNKAFEIQQDKIKHQTEFINKFRANKKLSSMVQSRIKVLAKMDMVEQISAESKFSWSFPDPPVLRKDLIVDVSNASFGYSPDKLLFENVNLTVKLDSRVGILGANGAGKSTLIKLIMEELRPRDGIISLNRQANIGYFAQHHVDQLDLSMNSIDYLRSKFPEAKPEQCFQQLSIYGLKDKVALQRIGTLSGGQKSRVSFAEMTWSFPHLIILDEPTNHCDMQTIDALIEAVNGFKGGVVVVSHDQHFLSHVCEEFWAVGKGKVKSFYDFVDASKYSYNREDYQFI